MKRTRSELILAGPNLRSWLSDEESKNGLIALVQQRHVRVTLILATYETLQLRIRREGIHPSPGARPARARWRR